MLVQIGKRDARTEALGNVRAERKAPTPTFAHIYVENRCHLHCDHCYESEDAYPPEPSALSVADYDKLFAQLKSMGIFVVTFSGGEVFLRKDFLDIVELARKHRFFIRVYTSGTLLTEEKVARMRALGVNEVHVSMYSHDAATHDAFTHHIGSWEKSVNGLQMLHDVGIKTVLKSNVLTFNVDHLDELLALAKKVGADLQLDPTVKPKQNGNTDAMRYAVSPEQIALKVLARPAFHRYVSLEEADGLCDGTNHRSGRDMGMCAAGSKILTVHADGNISPCTLFPLAAGNVLTDDIRAVWSDSPLFRNVRAQRFDDMTDCKTCDVARTCDPCMAYGLIENDDHRTCNTSSRRAAEALTVFAKHMTSADRKMTRGKTLPIVGNVEVPGLNQQSSNTGVVTEI
jgi:AdoMet-dependent heme synthase